MQSAERKTFHLNVFLNKCLRKHGGRENTSGGGMLFSGRGLVLKAFIVSKIEAVVGSAFQQIRSTPVSLFFFFF